jgi:hypothetical protein
MNDNTPTIHSIVKPAIEGANAEFAEIIGSAGERQGILNQAIDDLLNRGHSPSGIADTLRFLANEIGDDA